MVAPLTNLKPLFAATTRKAISYPYKSHAVIKGITFCVCLSAFLSALDGYIVAIALPSMAKDINQTIGNTALVMLVYMLFMTSIMPIGGKLGGLIGYRRIYIVGFLLFTVGSVICAGAPAFAVLLGGRMLQGTGAAVLTATGYALVSVHIEPDNRGPVLGLLGSVVAIAQIFGAPLGGFMAEHLGWRSVFWINIPVGLLAIGCGARLLPHDSRQRQPAPFDWTGSVLIMCFLSGLVYSLNQGNDHGWHSPYIWGTLTASLILIRIFWRVERRAADPVIHPSIFSQHSFVLAAAGVFLFAMTLGGSALVLPIALQTIVGLSPPAAGGYMLIISVMVGVVAPQAGKLAKRFGAKRLALTGLLIAIPNCLMFHALHTDMSKWHLIASLALAGFWIGLFVSPASTLAFSLPPREQQPIASGTIAVIKSIGMLVGAGLFQTTSSGFHLEIIHHHASHDYHDDAFLAMAVTCALAFVLIAMVRQPAPLKPTRQKNRHVSCIQEKAP